MSPSRPDVRTARSADVKYLPEVERLAGLMFKTYPEDLGIPEALYDQPNSVEAFAEARADGRLWVALGPEDKPVGFALVRALEDCAHLEEIDVLPSFGRQGIGSALLEVVCSWAERTRYSAVTLRTFRDVPWNGPFYSRRGFEIVPSATLSERHLALEASERERGLRTDNRVTMAYWLPRA